LTTAAQSSASNVSIVAAATNNTGGGTASLSGGVSFSNANGLTFYTSAGNAIVGSYSVPTVPTSYVSNVNGSSGAVSVAGLGTALNLTNLTGTLSVNTAGVSLSLSANSGGGGGYTTPRFEPFPANSATSFAANSLYFAAAYPQAAISFSSLNQMVSIATILGTSTWGNTFTGSYALYSKDSANANRLTLMSSSSYVLAISGSSTQNGGFTLSQGAGSYTASSTNLNAIPNGLNLMSMPFSGSIAGSGEYYVGMAISTSAAGATWNLSWAGATRGTGAINAAISPTTSVTNAVFDQWGFRYTSTSNAWPSSIASNSIQSVSANFAPYIQFALY